jgi:hypothetical protein
MMLNSQDKTPPADVPAVVPIFGRGRALGILAGQEINSDNLGAAAAFLTGACSCQVKQLNPGVDLLLAADWDSIFEQDLKPREPKVPEIPVGR